MNFRVVRHSEKEFAELKAPWEDLLARSDADPLFMSWAWLFSWWEVWAPLLNLELILLGIYDDADRLVGVAPLYRHSSVQAFHFPLVRRLHFIGSAWRVRHSVRTEYMGFVAERGSEVDIAAAIFSALASKPWDELVALDVAPDSRATLATAAERLHDVKPLIRSQARGVAVLCSGDFDEWLASLGRNTRLKAFNRRSVFEKELGGYFKHWPDGLAGHSAFLETLNALHRKRWNKPCFDSLAVRFHLKFLSRLSDNQEAQMTHLVINGETVSVLYDVRAGSRIYNLQAGFEEDLHKKLSLGTLHLGYAIEKAFLEKNAVEYDLLAGFGKNTFYKSHFNGREVEFSNIHYTRSPVLRTAYALQTVLPRRLVSFVNRSLRL